LPEQNGLKIEEDDPAINGLVRALKLPKGKLNIQIDNKPALSLDFRQDKVSVDIKDVTIFNLPGENKEDYGIFEKIKAAKKVAQILDNNDLTISILRKGKKAISLGKGVKPTLSRLVTGSDDIQIDSVRQAAKLRKDMKKNKDEQKI
jgi:hypothetical protein